MSAIRRRKGWSWVRLVGVCLVGVLLGMTVWLLDHLRPRDAHFEERQGTLQDAEVVHESQPGGFVSESVHLESSTGLAVNFRVLRPETGEARVPLVVILAGHRTGRNAVELVGDPGSMAVAALDYPYHGPEKLRGFWTVLKRVPEIQQAFLDTPPAVSLALDWLLQQPWVDPERVELVGASLGTPFAAVAGARDTRFRRVWFLHGGADNREWLSAALREDIGSAVLREPAAWLIHLIAHGATFDTDKWVARIAPRPVVVVGARQDEGLTHENVEALYAAAGEPKEIFWTEGRHVTRRRTEVVRDLLAIVRAQM